MIHIRKYIKFSIQHLHRTMTTITRNLTLNNLRNFTEISEITPIKSIQNIEKDVTKYLKLREPSSSSDTNNKYATLTGFDDTKYYYNSQDNFMKKIPEIDDKLVELNDGSSHICIEPNDEKLVTELPNNFKQLLEPLKNIYPWNEQRLDIFYRLCCYVFDVVLKNKPNKVFGMSENNVEQWFKGEWIYKGSEFIPKREKAKNKIVDNDVDSKINDSVDNSDNNDNNNDIDDDDDNFNNDAFYISNNDSKSQETENHWAKPFLDEWYEISNGNLNVHPIKRLLLELCKYKLSDIPVYYLVKERNELASIINNDRNRLVECLSSLKESIELEDLIQSAESKGFQQLCDLFPEYQFDKVFNDKLSQKTLQTMHQAVTEIPGALDFMIKDGSSWSENQMLHKITDHPLVEECGHTGMSVSWTLSNLKSIYTKGWNHWVKLTLVSKGIGISKLSFDEGIELKHEATCIYWFNKWLRSLDEHKIKIVPLERALREGVPGGPSDISESNDNVPFNDIVRKSLTSTDGKGLSTTKSYNMQILCEEINELKFEKLQDLVLSTIGKCMSSERYFYELYFNNLLNEHKLFDTYKKYWIMYYPNDAYVDCSMFDRKEFIRALWNQLPYNKYSYLSDDDMYIHVDENGKRKRDIKPVVLTDEEIDNALKEKYGIYELGKKNMHFLGGRSCKWNKLSTLFFDFDLGKFGTMKSICSKLTPIQQSHL
jgi:hypothetical protein